MVRAQQGFEYTAERPTQTEFALQKWGWTGLQPGAYAPGCWWRLFQPAPTRQLSATSHAAVACAGAWAELEIDTRSGTGGQARNATVGLTYLSSYEGMGVARISCIRGCVCSMHLLPCTHPRRVSVFKTHMFAASQHPACRVRVAIEHDHSKNKSDQHKVKLTAVSVQI